MSLSPHRAIAEKLPSRSRVLYHLTYNLWPPESVQMVDPALEALRNTLGRRGYLAVPVSEGFAARHLAGRRVVASNYLIKLLELERFLEGGNAAATATTAATAGTPGG